MTELADQHKSVTWSPPLSPRIIALRGYPVTAMLLLLTKVIRLGAH